MSVDSSGSKLISCVVQRTKQWPFLFIPFFALIRWSTYSIRPLLSVVLIGMSAFRLNNIIYCFLPIVQTLLRVNNDKKAELSQRWPRDAPYVWVPWKLSGVPDNAHGYFSLIFYGLCSDCAINVHALQCKARSCDRMSSVRSSVRDLGGSGPHRLEILETNTISPTTSLFVAQTPSTYSQGRL